MNRKLRFDFHNNEWRFYHFFLSHSLDINKPSFFLCKNVKNVHYSFSENLSIYWLENRFHNCYYNFLIIKLWFKQAQKRRDCSISSVQSNSLHKFFEFFFYGFQLFHFLASTLLDLRKANAFFLLFYSSFDIKRILHNW